MGVFKDSEACHHYYKLCPISTVKRGTLEAMLYNILYTIKILLIDLFHLQICILLNMNLTSRMSHINRLISIFIILS